MPEASQSKPELSPPETAEQSSRSGNFRSSVAQFLGALILMLFAAPFLDELEYGQAIDSMLITLVLILGVLAVGRSHRTLVLAVVLMVPAVVARWIHHIQPGLFSPTIPSFTALIFVGFVEFQLLHFIFSDF